MAAAMGFRSPFFCPIDKREEADKARKTFATGHSDLLTTLKAFDGWQARPDPTVTTYRSPVPHPVPAPAMRLLTRAPNRIVALRLPSSEQARVSV